MLLGVWEEHRGTLVTANIGGTAMTNKENTYGRDQNRRASIGTTVIHFMTLAAFSASVSEVKDNQTLIQVVCVRVFFFLCDPQRADHISTPRQFGVLFSFFFQDVELRDAKNNFKITKKLNVITSDFCLIFFLDLDDIYVFRRFKGFNVRKMELCAILYFHIYIYTYIVYLNR